VKRAARQAALTLLVSICSSAFGTSVLLKWKQSHTKGVTRNCVYYLHPPRGKPQLIYCSTTPITTYTDGAVLPGHTYHYGVTSLKGIEESNCDKANVVVK